MSETITDIVGRLAGVPTYYAADSGQFWALSEQQPSYPAIGLYERAGDETRDNYGVPHPVVELHVLTVGGAMDERTAPSANVADGRALLSQLLKRLRPWVLSPSNRCGFARHDAIYSNWATLEIRDPAARCPQ